LNNRDRAPCVHHKLIGCDEHRALVHSGDATAIITALHRVAEQYKTLSVNGVDYAAIDIAFRPLLQQ